MKLEQGQVWKVGDAFLRIVKWQRLSIEYKHITNWETREGEVHKVSKKEFCRLIRPGKLYLGEAEEVSESEDVTGNE
ncbi:hypothetical protein [Roseibacillus persicicus]|uniref:Uncharacterized protein n=1 Tax=Roseibacillus persicicus TaxID=454148 RepID=A0A918TEX6_9BACT|nr:hypothetical protein [Roseibacillus persicicus]MDQ8189078.1 hypothetical protein [Roseibacillus persicicus]GHC43176.1 hypothetical protein GCM10007100_05310 [Roseibacillus persicicus]